MFTVASLDFKQTRPAEFEATAALSHACSEVLSTDASAPTLTRGPFSLSDLNLLLSFLNFLLNPPATTHVS